MPARGHVILFLRGGTPAAGIVDEGKDAESNLVVVTAEGKRIRVQPGELLASGPSSPGQPREAAREWGRRIEAAAAGIPVAEIWEMHEGGSEMTSAEVVRAWFGKEPAFADRSALLSALWNDRVYFTRRGDRLLPEPRAKIEERLARNRDRDRKAGRMQAIEQAVKAISGGSGVREPPGLDPQEWSRFVRALRELAVHGPETPGTAEAVEILRSAGLRVEDAPFDLLVGLGEFEPDENLDLLRYGVGGDFPEAAKEEADRVRAALGDPGSWQAGREEAGDRAVTIDSERTVEVDDALTLKVLTEGWEIGVHIADVAALVPTGGAIEREAFSRGSTVYMPEGSIPMMPERLGRDGFSLDAGVPRPALSLVAEVRPDGVIGAWSFARTVLTVERRLTYEQADALVEEGDPVLSPLAAVGALLKAGRVAAGAVDLDLPELDVSVTGEGADRVIDVTVSRGTTPSHVLVSECAILYNRLAGRLLADRGIACIMRTQPAPSSEMPDVRSGGPAAEFAARRLLAPSTTGTLRGKHSTLGVEDYALATSPIRRSFDLVVQRQISAALGQGKARDLVEVDRILLQAGPAAQNAHAIDRARNRYWLLRYLDQRVAGQTMRGVVVERMSDRVIVHLPDWAIEAPLRMRDPDSLRKGEEIEVRLDRADARRDFVRISLVR